MSPYNSGRRRNCERCNKLFYGTYSDLLCPKCRNIPLPKFSAEHTQSYNEYNTNKGHGDSHHASVPKRVTIEDVKPRGVVNAVTGSGKALVQRNIPNTRRRES